MAAVRQLGFMVALGLVACACPNNNTGTDGGTDGGEIDCIDENDCPDPILFRCNSSSKCEPACRSKLDCTAEVRKQWALDYCASNLGCQCDEGKCAAALCSGDSDCGNLVCRDGKCVPPPAENSVASCQIAPDFTVLKVGAKAKFYVSLWDANLKPVVPKGGVSWSALGGTGTVAASGLSAELSAASATTGPVEAIQAAIGSATCKAKVIVFDSAVPADKLDVVVMDELSGRPVENASVLVSNPTSGQTVGTPGNTDARGYARLAIPNGRVTVTVFHNDYNYLTVANYDMATASADARFLSLVVRRNPVDKYGGYRGTFNNVSQNSSVHVGIAGMSLAGAITDLSLNQLLGPNVPVHLKLGSALDKPNTPLPAGLYLGLTDNKIKDTISGQGLAGVCTTAGGATDETAIGNGSCGTRTAWALAGDVPMGPVTDLFAGGTSNLDFSKAVTKLLPLFKKFNSSITRDVQFTLKQTPAPNPPDGGAYDFSDTSQFKQQDHEFAQIPMAFSFVMRSPDFPKYRGDYLNGMVLLGGATVPGRGVVPLGLGAGANSNPRDAKIDTQAELPGPGLIGLRMAPTHHGLEGTPYGVVALVVSETDDAWAGSASSAIFARLPNNQLLFDPKGAQVIDLPGPYLKVPEEAKYNFTDSTQLGLSGRSFRFNSDPGLSGAGQANLVRVVFSDRLEHRWVVYLDPAHWSTGFTLPKPPNAFPDRTFHNGGMAGDERSSLLVQAMRLSQDPGSTSAAPISFQSLVELNSTNSDRMVDFTAAFAFVDYDRPQLTWKEPKPGSTIAPGSTVKVRVEYFKIGTGSSEGHVKLSFEGGTGCTPLEVTTDPSGGKQELPFTLPQACAGQNVKMTATLYGNSDDQPIQPPAASSLTVNIQ